MHALRDLYTLPDDIRQQLLAFVDSGALGQDDIGQIAVAMKQRLGQKAIPFNRPLRNENAPLLRQQRGI